MTDQPRPPGTPPPYQYGQNAAPPPGAYSYPPYPPPPGRTGPGTGMVFLQSCLVAGCATVLAPFVAMIALIVVFAMFIGNIDASGWSGSSSPLFTEKTLREGDASGGKIVVVDVRGQIMGQGSSLSGSGTVGRICEQLNMAAADREVKAVLLQVDSPGGGLTASDLIYNRILGLRGEGKIVVVWVGSLAASGGYYVSVAADAIVASPTAMVGSIGVVMQHYQIDGLMKMLGLKVDPIMAGDSKDIGSVFRDMTPEERKILQEMVDESHRRFIDVVARGRALSVDQATKLANGMLYGARDAVANGLIDDTGYINDAVELTEELVGAKNMRIVRYNRVFSLMEAFDNSNGSVQTFFDALTRKTDATPKMAAEWPASAEGTAW